MKFKLFGRLRGKKPAQEMVKAGEFQDQEILQSIIGEMISKGISEQEIIRNLSSQGYSYSSIMDALNQFIKQSAQSGAIAKGAVESGAGEFQMPTSEPYEPYRETIPKESAREAPMPESEYEGYEKSALIPERTEELIEIIVSEKMIDIEEEFEKIRAQISKINKTLGDLDSRLKELEIRKDEDEKKFLTKMEELEEFLENSQSRIGGLEKALQQVLPTLVENMKNVTASVREMKKFSP